MRDALYGSEVVNVGAVELYKSRIGTPAKQRKAPPLADLLFLLFVIGSAYGTFLVAQANHVGLTALTPASLASTGMIR